MPIGFSAAKSHRFAEAAFIILYWTLRILAVLARFMIYSISAVLYISCPLTRKMSLYFAMML